METAVAQAHRQVNAVIVIIDGLGDLPVAGLRQRTPLEAAETPCLDRWASGGEIGLLDPIGPGIIPHTHSGVGVLMGMHPKYCDQLGRGVVEAAGLGVSIGTGDVALRCNFGTVESVSDALAVRDRRAGRIGVGTKSLAEALNQIELEQGVRHQFRATSQHRGVLILSGEGLDHRVTDTDPGDHDSSQLIRICRPLHPDAQRTADLVNRFSERARAILSGHEVNRGREREGLPVANAILMRGAAGSSEIRGELSDRNLTSSLVSGCNTVKGLGRLLGMTVLENSSFTADLETDLDAKIDAAISAMRESRIVFVHVKGPDLCAHDLDPVGKRDFLQRIDVALRPLTETGALLAVATDHTTDSNSGRHTADPVPCLISLPDQRHASACSPMNFGETACRNGALRRITSRQFLECILQKISV